MDNITLLNDLVLKIQSRSSDLYKEVEAYIEDYKTKPLIIPGSRPLRDPNYFLQMYSTACTSFNQCSTLRISLGKVVIDINSVLTQIKKVRTEVTLMASFVQTLNQEKEKCLEYQKVLEIQQRNLDSQLRYYSSVQYVFGSPHWLQGE